MVRWASFGKPEVFPDRLLSIRQKLMESAKIETLKCGILGNFQTILRVLRKLFFFNVMGKSD